MKSLLAAAAVLLCSDGVLAQEPKLVKPQFHPLNREAGAEKRRLPSAHKAAAIAAPIRFETRAAIDDRGELHLDCEEVDADSGERHRHEH